MKTILLTAATTVMAAACLYAQTAGVIRITASPELPFVVMYRVDQYGIREVYDTLKISKNKDAFYLTNQKYPNNLYLMYGKKSCKLWVTPGVDIAVDITKDDPVFSGKDALFSEYYVAERKNWAKISDEYKKRNPGFNDQPNLFTLKYFSIQDSITLQRVDYLKDYFKTTNDSHKDQFIRTNEAELVYSSLYYKLTYSGSDETRFGLYQKVYGVSSPVTYLFSDAIPLTDMSLANVYYYRQFLRQFAMNIAGNRAKVPGQPFSITRYVDTAMRIIDRFATDRRVNLLWKAVFLNNLTDEIQQNRKMDYAEKVYGVLTTLDQHAEPALVTIKEKLDKTVHDTRFRKGQPAPDVALLDAAGKKYTLADFSGKKVLIDLGASWCGPCISAIPDWNRLVEENDNNRNVVFISLSLDDNQEDWKKFLGKHNVKGLQLFAGEGFSGPFAKAYEIVSIPHLVLLDEKGKFIEYAAPRPDTKEIRSLLSAQ